MGKTLIIPTHFKSSRAPNYSGRRCLPVFKSQPHTSATAWKGRNSKGVKAIEIRLPDSPNDARGCLRKSQTSSGLSCPTFFRRHGLPYSIISDHLFLLFVSNFREALPAPAHLAPPFDGLLPSPAPQIQCFDFNKHALLLSNTGTSCSGSSVQHARYSSVTEGQPSLPRPHSITRSARNDEPSPPPLHPRRSFLNSYSYLFAFTRVSLNTAGYWQN